MISRIRAFVTSAFLGVNGLALVVGWLVPLDLGVQGSETVGPSLAEGEFVRISPRSAILRVDRWQTLHSRRLQPRRTTRAQEMERVVRRWRTKA